MTSRAFFKQQQLQNSQFVFGLDPRTLLPIDIAAPVVDKSVSTFRTDVTRRPSALPRLTRIGRRVFVRVADLIAFITPPAEADVEPARRPARRPTKAEARVHAATQTRNGVV
jgi:hypothetical protein